MQGPKPEPEEELRQLLLCGAVADAAARLRQLAPSLADNQWLIFQLKKHQFMHMAVAAAAGASKEAQAHQLHEALGALPPPLGWGGVCCGPCLHCAAECGAGVCGPPYILLLLEPHRSREHSREHLWQTRCCTSLLNLQSWHGGSWRRWRCTPIAKRSRNSSIAC